MKTKHATILRTTIALLLTASLQPALAAGSDEGF